MREDTNCSRIDNKIKSSSETHVAAMNNSEIGCKRRLHQSKTCGCIYDGDAKSLRGSECQVPRVRSMEFTGNEAVDINENVERYINQLPESGKFNINISSPGQSDWSCPRICIDSTKENRPLVTVDNVCNLSETEEDDKCPVIRLSLRKPRQWKWKLTTSASSPAIILPAIQLLNEEGDLLLDTRKRSNSKHRRKLVDSNGNDNDLHPVELEPNHLQKSKSERFNIAPMKRRVDRLNNETSESLAKDIKEKQNDGKEDLLLKDRRRSMTPKRENPDNTTGDKGATMCPKSKSQKNPLTKDSKEYSDADDLTAKSLKGFRTKRKSRSCNKKKAHLQCRRKIEKRHNWEDCSTSSDSSPKLRRRMKNRATTDKKGKVLRKCLKTGF